MLDNTCVRKNELGECIEWKKVGNELVAEFKEQDKTCNKALWDMWKQKFKERSIKVKLEE